jgi:Fe-S-cluster containining protein
MEGNLLISLIKNIFNEFCSYLVVDKVKYSLKGNCRQCGDCCRKMYSIGTYTEKEFNFMKKIFPKYKRFEITGRDEFGNLLFACTLLDENGLCSDYKHRLRMCKNYPHKNIKYGGELPPNCGFKILTGKSFKDYLKGSK